MSTNLKLEITAEVIGQHEIAIAECLEIARAINRTIDLKIPVLTVNNKGTGHTWLNVRPTSDIQDLKEIATLRIQSKLKEQNLI